MERPLVKYFIENKPLPPSEIEANITVEDLENLRNLNILSKSNGIWIFEFVGIVALKDQLWVVFPKIYESSNGHESTRTKLLVDVFRKYRHDVDYIIPGIDFFNNTLQETYVNELEIADQLILDYLKNGVWEKRESRNLINQTGEIHWESTIEKLDPIISCSGPIYGNTYNKKRNFLEDRILTSLHKWAVSYSFNRYGTILGYNYSDPFPGIGSLGEIGKKTRLDYLIKSQLSEVYTDREIRLFKSILALIRGASKTLSSDVSLFGTRHFHRVWELACSRVFNNKYKRFKNEMPRPEWFLDDNNCYKSATLIPDVLALDEIGGRAIILDAKYYPVKFQSHPPKVLNHPGVIDLVKQYFYADILSDIVQRDCYNCFVFPTEDAEMIQLSARTEFHTYRGQQSIACFLAPFSEFLKAYVNSNKLSDQQIFQLIEMINDNIE